MDAIINLLQRIVSLLTALVIAIVPGSTLDPLVSEDRPVIALSDVMPIAVSSFYGLGGSTMYSTSANPYFSFFSTYGSSSATIPATSLSVGIPVSITTGMQATVTFSGFSFGRNTVSLSSAWSNYKITQFGWVNNNSLTGTNTAYTVSDYRLVDQNGNTLVPVSGVSGTYSFTADHDITYIGFSVTFNSYVTATYKQIHSYINATNASMTVSTSNPVNDAILGIYASTADIALSNRAILAALQNIAGSKSAMEEFEEKYLDQMGDQLDQVEEMMSPSNTALPNGGDFAGFFSDIQNGLGVSGDSFNSQEFSDALGAYGDTTSTGVGGPWEFFTQTTADNLAGSSGASAAGLSDDDYFLQWMEQAKQRMGDLYDSVVG